MMLQILVGTIASGKSTYCLNAAKKGYIICNDDAIVTAVHGGDYSLYNEKLKPLYKSVENMIVTTALAMGKNVVVDRGLNLTRSSRRRFVGLADSVDAKVIGIRFPTQSADEHALRRFNHDSRGRSLEYWKKVAEAHIRRYEDFNCLIEGIDKAYYPSWEEIASGKLY